ncbi:uncharacterized protein PHALS_02357 [Plasmopara halstedii]|uniref:Uncharacterized protein n=1 Tax=Plasmopara halstedii TaxID=4781 RepID=A0A0P1AXJ3_PLAHL|nr:uncharacterized protein PHALS_02357 [Plasmopara halstedii]CEG46030.1 hypothetical protein PHALS_02357 [Plasmopara halstedii]|eukprot:XP_024582399.1 hypothetical protein PHALS_02357 [Plasmopara halstedii]
MLGECPHLLTPHNVDKTYSFNARVEPYTPWYCRQTIKLWAKLSYWHDLSCANSFVNSTTNHGISAHEALWGECCEPILLFDLGAGCG